MKDKKTIIAIDFDGTITEWSPYPIMGKIRFDAIKYIKKLYEDGYYPVLWTCRSGDYLDEALKALEDAGIMKYFYKINDDGLDNRGRKIVAAYYIDDRSVPGELDWEETYYYIKGNIEVK